MRTENAGPAQPPVPTAHRFFDQSNLAIIAWIGRGVATPRALAEHMSLTVERLSRLIAPLVEAECIVVDSQGNCRLGARVQFTDDGDTFRLSVASEGGRPVTISGPTDFAS